MEKELPNLFEGYVLYGINNKNRYSPVGVVTEDGRRKAKCSLSNIPKSLVEKLIQIEDVRFYKHFGIDFKAIGRATLENIKAKKIVQGGSTITQQLARNLFHDNSISLFRKFREILFAIYLEFRYSKEKIIELYFNSVFWGTNIYGLRSASLHYFGKEVNKISNSEETKLLTLLRGPNYYLKQKEAYKKRLNMLNRKLFQSNIQSKKAFTKNLNSSLNLQQNKMDVFRKESVPFITDSIDNISFSIYTTLNKKLQEQLSKSVLRQKIPLSIVVIIDGKVRAISSTHGSNHPFLYKSNVGSTLKPFIYTILRKFGLDGDEQIPINNGNVYNWSIREATKNNFNHLTLKRALLLSNNNAFVNASIEIGLSKVLQEIKQLIPSQPSLSPSIILGASPKGISLYELTLLYNNFFKENSDEIINECRNILNETLSKRLNLKIEAGYLKTGTTNDFKQRFAIFGTGNTTIGFLTEGYRDIEEEDYEKDEDYLFVVKSFISNILKTL